LQKVTFKGVLVIPRESILVFTHSQQQDLRIIHLLDISMKLGPLLAGRYVLVGAESALIIRSGGELNFDYATFVGPTHNPLAGITYQNTVKYNSSAVPTLASRRKIRSNKILRIARAIFIT
jgi:hypothetical protein